jgi:hypothetical protein
MRKQDTAAGNPAASPRYLRPISEQDREIVRRIDRGDDRLDIGHELRIGLATIKGSEKRVKREAKARELLAADPQSIDGLYLSGQMPGHAMSYFRFHTSYWETPEIRRLSDVAALGRLHWSSNARAGVGPKTLGAIDGLLEQAGIEWANDGCAPKRKEREPIATVPALPRSDADIFVLIDRLRAEVEMQRREIAKLRGGDAHRQTSEGREDLETAGNIVCMPGVRLADVLPQNGGAA